MSSSTQAGAERKFWQVPEMVEKLLEHLDVSGTLELAELHVLTLQILQGASGTLKPLVIGRQLGQDTFEQQRVMVGRAGCPHHLGKDGEARAPSGGAPSCHLCRA